MYSYRKSYSAEVVFAEGLPHARAKAAGAQFHQTHILIYSYTHILSFAPPEQTDLQTHTHTEQTHLQTHTHPEQTDSQTHTHTHTQVECTVCCNQCPSTLGIMCCGEIMPGLEPVAPHFVCSECFCSYILTSCEDRTIELDLKNKYALQDAPDCLSSPTGMSNQPPKGVSPSGSLPCPFFKTGGCSDGQIADKSIYLALLHQDKNSSKTRAYRATVERVAVEKYRKEEQERQNKMKPAPIIENARLQVEGALHCGQVVQCPGCHIPTRKDDACMHMTCLQCSVRFCYVCGIDRYSKYPAGGR
jgi:hypothetical protein